MIKVEELFIEPTATVLETLRKLDETGQRILFIAPEGHLKAVITDGDIRKFFLRGGTPDQTVDHAANYHPLSVSVSERGKARSILQEHCIDALPVLNKRGIITDIIFAHGLDLDNRKQVDIPVVMMAGGLGTRLYPYTKILPKPLIPFFHEPLILHSMRRCYDCGIREFIINTHHLAAAWDKVFPEHSWNGCPVHFSHEPVLLDSGGGVKKIEPLASAEEPLLVVNGDMAATFDLGRLLEEHLSRRPPVTLALRTSGDKKNVGFDFSSGLVTDMRHALGRDPGSYQFTGAYCMEPEIFRRIPSGEAVSIIPLFLDYIREGRLRGILADDGLWMDMGTPEAYLQAHLDFPSPVPRIHPQARVSPRAFVDSHCVIGPGAAVEDGCRLQGCVVWPGVCVPSGTCAERRIFYCSPTDY